MADTLPIVGSNASEPHAVRVDFDALEVGIVDAGRQAVAELHAKGISSHAIVRGRIVVVSPVGQR